MTCVALPIPETSVFPQPLQAPHPPSWMNPQLETG
jgi:hypothetical protein